MSCDVGEVTERLENELRIFTYVTWRASHDAHGGLTIVYNLKIVKITFYKYTVWLFENIT